MIIGFTGTQKGLSFRQKNFIRTFVENTTIDCFVHGDCIGADEEAHNIVRKFSPKTEIVTRPCNIRGKRAFCKGDWAYPSKPPLERNKDIVNQCDLLIAAPYENVEKLRSGTWSTIRYAKKVGKLLLIVSRTLSEDNSNV